MTPVYSRFFGQYPAVIAAERMRFLASHGQGPGSENEQLNKTYGYKYCLKFVSGKVYHRYWPGSNPAEHQ